MAVSSSIDFSITEKKLISSALRIVGAAAHDKEPSRDVYMSARFCLNLICKELDALGFKPWSLTTSTAVTTVIGQATYGSSDNLPTNIFRVEAIQYIYASNDHRNVALINQKKYDAIIDKTLSGDPEYALVNEAVVPSDKTITFWPVPSAAKSIRLRYFRIGYDMDADGDDIDFPADWGNYLRYELAASLGEEFGLSDAKMQRLIERARYCHDKVKSKAVVKTDNLTPENGRYY